MTAIDRSMLSPEIQRWLHDLAAETQRQMIEVGVHPEYTYQLERGEWVRIEELHRYSAECSYGGFTFLVPLPKENWP